MSVSTRISTPDGQHLGPFRDPLRLQFGLLRRDRTGREERDGRLSVQMGPVHLRTRLRRSRGGFSRTFLRCRSDEGGQIRECARGERRESVVLAGDSGRVRLREEAVSVDTRARDQCGGRGRRQRLVDSPIDSSQHLICFRFFILIQRGNDALAVVERTNRILAAFRYLAVNDSIARPLLPFIPSIASHSLCVQPCVQHADPPCGYFRVRREGRRGSGIRRRLRYRQMRRV